MTTFEIVSLSIQTATLATWIAVLAVLVKRRR